MRHAHPEDAAAAASNGSCQPVYRRHDVARCWADRVADRVVHKRVLQIDHDQCGLVRIEFGEAMLCAAPLDNPPYDLVRNGCAVEFHTRLPRLPAMIARSRMRSILGATARAANVARA